MSSPEYIPLKEKFKTFLLETEKQIEKIEKLIEALKERDKGFTDGYYFVYEKINKKEIEKGFKADEYLDFLDGFFEHEKKYEKYRAKQDELHDKKRLILHLVGNLTGFKTHEWVYGKPHSFYKTPPPQPDVEKTQLALDLSVDEPK